MAGDERDADRAQDCFCRYETTPVMCPAHGVLPTHSDEDQLDFELPCYECGGFDGHTFVMRKVVKEGPVVDRADPTQTYVLECGHTVI